MFGLITKKFKSVISNKDSSNINWDKERYDLIIVQRNILLLILLGFILLSIISVLTIIYISSHTEVKPFIIQIDNDTGRASLIKESDNNIDQNDSLARFFIKQYISARETYNYVDFSTLAMKKVRTFSDSNIFREFLSYIRNPAHNPVTRYARNNSTYLLIKSWSKISSNHYIIRFSINETTGQMLQFHKIAVINFEYLNRNMSEAELDINPVGFTVVGYRVDEDEA